MIATAAYYDASQLHSERLRQTDPSAAAVAVLEAL